MRTLETGFKFAERTLGPCNCKVWRDWEFIFSESTFWMEISPLLSMRANYWLGGKLNVNGYYKIEKCGRVGKILGYFIF